MGRWALILRTTRIAGTLICLNVHNKFVNIKKTMKNKCFKIYIGAQLYINISYLWVLLPFDGDNTKTLNGNIYEYFLWIN